MLSMKPPPRLWLLSAVLLTIWYSAPLSAAVLTIKPDTTNASHIYETVTVEIAVADVDSLAAVALDLSYEPELLEFLHITEGDFLRGSGIDSIATSLTYSHSTGSLVIGLTQLGESMIGRTSLSDTALMYITFRVLLFGSGELNLTNTSLLTFDGLSEIPHTSAGATVVASYPLHNTSVRLTPDSTTATLLEDVVLSLTVDSVAHLHAYSADMAYPGRLLALDSVIEGPLLSTSSSGQSAFAYDYDPAQGTITVGGSILASLDTGVTVDTASELARLYFTASAFDTGTITCDQAALLAPNGESEYPISTLGAAHVTVPPTSDSVIVAIDPVDTIVYQTQRLRLTLTADNVDRLSAFTADLSYPVDLIHVDSIIEGPAFNSQGYQTYFAYEIDSVAGLILAGGSILSMNDESVTAYDPVPLAYVYVTALVSDSVQFEVDQIGLFAPDGVTGYPVAEVSGGSIRILPTTEATFRVGDSGAVDVSVYASSPTTNFATDTLLSVATDQSEALLRFHMGSVGSEALISSAVLQVHRSGGASQDTLVLFRPNAEWVDTTVVWDTRPDTVDRIREVRSDSGWLEVDLSQTVQAWISGTVENRGLLISTPGGSGLEALFSSGEHADTALRPRLVVNYYYPPTCPDLVPAGTVEFSQAPIVEGDTVGISVDIYNTGVTAVSNVLVRIYDGVPLVGQYALIDEVVLPYVEGYGFATASVLWATEGWAGERTIFVRANADNAVTECDTLNNKRSFFTRILERSNLWSDCGHLDFSTTAPTEGDIVGVDFVFYNGGEASAGNYSTLVHIVRPNSSPILLDSIPAIGALATDEADSVHIDWNTTGLPGNSSIRISLDATNAVLEQNESDNVFSCPITVYNPNLTATVDCPVEAAPNDTISYILQLKNVGVVAAKNATATIGLPNGLSLLGSTPAADSGYTLRWSFDTLLAGSQQTISIDLLVETSLQSGSIVDLTSQITYSNLNELNPTTRNTSNSITIGDDVTPPQVLVSLTPNIVSIDTVLIECVPSESLLISPIVTVVSATNDTLVVDGPVLNGEIYQYALSIDQSTGGGQAEVTVSVQDLAGNQGQAVTSFLVDHTAPGVTLSLPDTLSLGTHSFTVTANEQLSLTPVPSALDSSGDPIPINYKSRQGLVYTYECVIDDSVSGGWAPISIPIVDIVGNDIVFTDSAYILSERPALVVSIPDQIPFGQSVFTVIVNKRLATFPQVAGYDNGSFKLNIAGPAATDTSYQYFLHVDSSTAPGTAHINVQVTDQYGNTADTTVAFDIDPSAPLIDVFPVSAALDGSYSMSVSSNEILAGAPLVRPFDRYSHELSSLTYDSIAGDTVFWYSGSTTAGISAFGVAGTDLAGNLGQATRSYCDFEILREQISFSDQPMGGVDVAISAWVHNRGSAAVDSVPIEIWQGYPGYGMLLDSLIWVSIADGDSTLVTVNWLSSQQSSSYVINVVADRQGRFKEIDEYNNRAWTGSVGLIAFTSKGTYVIGYDSSATAYCRVFNLSTGQSLTDSLAAVTADLRDTLGQTIVANQVFGYDTATGYFTWKFNPTLLLDPGPYRVHFHADAGGPSASAFDSVEFAVYRGAEITCQSEFLDYYRRDTVRIMGQVQYVDSTPAAAISIITAIKNNGGTRVVRSTTDTAGNFVASLILHPLEAGAYTAITEFSLAGHEFADTCTFTVQGLLLTPTQFSLTMSQNSSSEIPVGIKNIGTAGIQIDSMRVRQGSGGVGIVVSIDQSETDFSLTSGQSTQFTATVSASPTAVSHSIMYVDIFFSDSLLETTTIDVTAKTARPFITGTPGNPEFYLNPGRSLTKQIRVYNEGYTAWRDIEPQGKLPSWLNVHLPDGLDSLVAGDQFAFELTATTGSTMAPGIYDTTYTFQSSNYEDVTFPVRLYVTDTTTGSIRFAIVSEAGGTISGASVSLYSQEYDPISHSYPTFRGTSDQGGAADFVDLPTGAYAYQVSAPEFVTKTGNVTIGAGQGLDVIETVVLEPEAITVNWTVQDTTVEDSYNITLDMTYNTSVPFPVIVPHVIAHAGRIGDIIYGSFTLTNLGERTATRVSFQWPINDYFAVELNGNLPPALDDGLQPSESVEINYKIEINSGLPDCGEIPDWLTIHFEYDNGDEVGHVEMFGQFLISPDCGGLRIDPPVITSVEIPCLLYGPECDCDLSELFMRTDYLTATNVSGNNIQLHPIFALEGSVGITDAFTGGILQVPKWVQTFDRFIGIVEAPGVGSWDRSFLEPQQTAQGRIDHFSLPTLILSVSGGLAFIPYEVAEYYFAIKTVPILRVSIGDLGISELLSCLPFNLSQDYVYSTCPSCSGFGGGGGGSWGAGFRSIPDPPDVEDDQGGIVRLRLNQELTVERQAFSGTLELINGFTSYGVNDLDIDIAVKDENGFLLSEDQYSPASPLFFSVPELRGVSDVDGTGSIFAGDTGSANWLIIPKTDAGGTLESGRKYYLTANLSYTINGQPFSYETPAEEITVLPQPKLDLYYFVPRAIQQNVPFYLALQVANVGYGTADSLRVDSEQPVVLGGSEYLDRFEIIASKVLGQPHEKSLLVNFGDLLPQTKKIAYWQVVASPSGFIDEFTMSYEHDNALGGLSTSLVNQTYTGRILRSGLGIGTSYPASSTRATSAITQSSDFDGMLVDLTEDNVPDAIYNLINAEQLEVSVIQPDSVIPPGFSDPVMTIHHSDNNQWIYLRTADPFLGTKEIDVVTRNDGTLVPQQNYWLDSGYVYICDDPYSSTKYTVEFVNLAYKPDLVAGPSMSFSACPDCGDIDAGDTAVAVVFDVTNLGSVKASNVWVHLYDGNPSYGLLIDSVVVDSILPDSTVSTEIWWKTGPAPNWVTWYHRVHMVVDQSNAINESDEYNNVLSQGVELELTTGDASHDGTIDVADIMYEINWIFKHGPKPIPTLAGDVNCDAVGNIIDVVWLVNFLFKAGEAPCDPRLPGQKISPAPQFAGLITLNADQYKPGSFCITVNGTFDTILAGLQQELRINSDAIIIDSIITGTKLDSMPLFWSLYEDLLTLGAVDPSGKNLISAGDGDLLSIFVHLEQKAQLTNGIFELLEVVAVDPKAQPIEVEIKDAQLTLTPLPNHYDLSQNYPNPFNPSTTIEFALPVSSNTSLTIYNILGQKVKVLVDRYLQAGYHQIVWDGHASSGNEAATGVYFYRIEADDYVQSKKMLLIR